METMINRKPRIPKGLFFVLSSLLFSVALTACQGDWDEPSLTMSPYGNNSITEDGIISIADLKAQYSSVVFASTDTYAEIDKDIKIKGYVVGNDLGSNLYKQIVIQDATGGIVISVNQSGMHGFLAEGQEVIIDLKGLCIGGYRKQPQIGMPYYSDKYGVQLGRMYKELFQQHFKCVGQPNPNAVVPAEFNINWDKDANCGKLVKLTDISFARVDGLGTFAPDSSIDKTVSIVGGCVNRVLNEYKESQLVVRTSTYAKFAAKKLPFNEVDKIPLKGTIIGIATRYNNVWQILIRKESDIQF